MKRNRIKALLFSGTMLLALAFPGCEQREKEYYLPKDQYPQIQRRDRDAVLPAEEEPDDTDSVVLPFVPFEEETK